MKARGPTWFSRFFYLRTGDRSWVVATAPETCGAPATDPALRGGHELSGLLSISLWYNNLKTFRPPRFLSTGAA